PFCSQSRGAPAPFGLQSLTSPALPLFTPRRPTKAAECRLIWPTNRQQPHSGPVWLNYGGLRSAPRCCRMSSCCTHVDAYVNVFQVDKASFWLAELLFLVWNSVNDYVFGWLSDGGTPGGSAAGRSLNAGCAMLARFGPLLALSFALMWLRWLPGWPAVAIPCALHRPAGGPDSAPVGAAPRLSLGGQPWQRRRLGSVFVSYLVWDRARPAAAIPPVPLAPFLACVALAGYLLFQSGHSPSSPAPAPRPSDEVDPSEAQEMPSKPLCSQLRSFSREQSSTEYSASTVSLIGSAVLAVSFVLPHLKQRGLPSAVRTPTEPTQLVSDLVDEDYAMHRRSEPISALIFGSTALLSKTRPDPRPAARHRPILAFRRPGPSLVRTDLWPPERPPLDSAARLGCLRVLGLGAACLRLRAIGAVDPLQACTEIGSVESRSCATDCGLGLPHCALCIVVLAKATAQPRPLIEYLSWLYEFYGQMGKFKMTEKQLTGYREKAGAKLAEFQGLIDSLCRCAVYLFQQHRDDAFIYDVLSRVGVVDSVKPYLKSSDVELQVHALILIAFALDES
uniref:EXS domain-containing protein n=1 Tax=Macrostomum lignano TaxID=282301 RepID=A0A1I8F3G5_9PLAT